MPRAYAGGWGPEDSLPDFGVCCSPGMLESAADENNLKQLSRLKMNALR